MFKSETNFPSLFERKGMDPFGAVEVDATMSVDDKYQPFEELDMFDDVATVELAAGKQGYAVMIFAAIPLKEPIAWRGPIVMNKDSEIQRAYRELQIGTFLKKRVNYNYQERALTK